MEKINCPSHPRHQAELGQIIFISTDLSCNTGQCKEEVSMRYSPLENILALILMVQVLVHLNLISVSMEDNLLDFPCLTED